MKRGLRTRITDLADSIGALSENEHIEALSLLVRRVAQIKDTPMRALCYELINEQTEEKKDGISL